MFAYELQRRLAGVGSSLRSYACHPGYAATGLQSHTGSRLQGALMALGNKVIAQSDEMGALPTMFAATQDLPGGSYVGPDGFLQMRGRPTVPRSTKASKDQGVAAKLWDKSEELTVSHSPCGPRRPDSWCVRCLDDHGDPRSFAISRCSGRPGPRTGNMSWRRS
jgi:hypothetical protein